jgi:3-deoxy-7-phosphoheptulonate synthase/chorismate mutase
VSDRDLERLRTEVAAADAEILALVNRRLGLVREIRAYKRAHGLDFLDPAQEERLLARLRAENGGPLSGDGVERLFREILGLVKREL